LPYPFFRKQINDPDHSAALDPLTQSLYAYGIVFKVVEAQADNAQVKVVEMSIFQQCLVFLARLIDNVLLGGEQIALVGMTSGSTDPSVRSSAVIRRHHIWRDIDAGTALNEGSQRLEMNQYRFASFYICVWHTLLTFPVPQA
jgi:hypothetical protein